ncbi:unnamed protein product [Dovyalis caffra]|uniref:Peptidase A1 domain-containing protein n=2 Tax=rosids TaxID=71275 RepID=A0AAV1SEN8_9ROSI|nr:unnamed protein product [Dovyalis caffra]
MYGGDEVSAIVIDLGSHTCKAGYAGEDAPKAVFPSVVGSIDQMDVDDTTSNEKNAAVDSKNNGKDSEKGKGKRKLYVGSQSLGFRRDHMEVLSPFKDGIVADWDMVDSIWDHAFRECLLVDPKEHPMLLAEPSSNSQQQRERAAELMFEKYNVPALFLAKNAVLTSFASGRATSLVVDSGGGSTTIAPVHDGYVLQKAVASSPIGGELLTDCLLKSLENKKGIMTVDLDFPNTTESYRLYSQRVIASDIKECVCRAPDTPYDESSYSNIPMTPYELPDGQTIEIGADRFKIPDILFNPSLVQTIPGMDNFAEIAPSVRGLPQMVIESINKCDVDIRRELFSSILLAGGTASMQQLKERLEKDLLEESPQAARVKVLASGNATERRFSVTIAMSSLLYDAVSYSGMKSMGLLMYKENALDTLFMKVAVQKVVSVSEVDSFMVGEAVFHGLSRMLPLTNMYNAVNANDLYYYCSDRKDAFEKKKQGILALVFFRRSPQLKGVVIISLPPPDNPSLGKTITAFTLTNDDYPQSHQTQTQTQTQTHQEDQLPVQPLLPQNPQRQFPLSRLSLGTPRKLLSFVCISLFAIAIYSSLFTNTFQKLESDNNDNDDDRKPTSFVFPLYHKLGIHEIPLNDLENHLKRFVYKENLVASVDDLNGPHKITKLASPNTAAVDSSTIFPVRGNLYPDGLYFTYMLVGSPPRPYYLDIDTGSDLTWIQCDAPCTSCAKGANALYKPRRGNIVPPKDLLCMDVQRNQKAGYCEACEQCDYEIEYADHSSSMGVLATDKLHLMVANGSLTKLNFVFGCAYDQQGLLLKTLVKTDGILGLTRAKVSLPSQLTSQGIINNVVGHCLTTDVGGGGYMFLGDDFVPRRGMAWVPMLDSPSMEFYHTEIVKLHYGSSALSLGGVESRVKHILFDSGSSYTYFPKEAYSGLVASVSIFWHGHALLSKHCHPFYLSYTTLMQLNEVSGAGLIQDTSDPTLPICWRPNSPIRSVKDVEKFFKTLTLQFGTKWLVISTKFRIPPEGYLVISDKGNVCLGILDGSKAHDGYTIILGDISLRGQLVVYDNVNKKIGWTPSDCAKPKRLDSLESFDGLPFFDGKRASSSHLQLLMYKFVESDNKRKLTSKAISNLPPMQ